MIMQPVLEEVVAPDNSSTEVTSLRKYRVKKQGDFRAKLVRVDDDSASMFMEQDGGLFPNVWDSLGRLSDDA